MSKRLFLEDIEKVTDNKYLAVCIAAKRAKQLSEGAKPIIDIDAVKDSTIALHELAMGKLNYTYKEIEPPEEEEIGIFASDTEDISEAEAEFNSIFKEEYVNDFGEDDHEEEPEEGI